MTGRPRQGFLAVPRAGRMASVQPPASPCPNARAYTTATPLRRSPGRPSLFTAEVWEQILNGLAEGIPLSRICATPGMPCPETIRCWRRDDPGFAREFDFAQQCGWDYLAFDLVRRVNDATCQGDAAAARAILSYGRWYLARQAPSYFGGHAR